MAANQKNFIIQFHARYSGGKMVVKKVHSTEKAVNKMGKQMSKGSKQAATLGQKMKDMAVRSALVVPIWMALRSVYMGVFRTIGQVISAQLDLEDSMARIRTVMHGTPQEIAQGMSQAKDAILDATADTSLSIKEVGEAFYFLKTANLEADEALSALTPTLNAVLGTGADVEEVTRAIAGIYNTMADNIEGATTKAEKFEKISDVLTYTYATQEVQMNELTQSYIKIAPFASGLADSFTEITTVLGFLNTQMLKSGRTGRLTGRAILQLTKNADKLATIFGITFDPDAPIDFLEVIGQIRDRLGENAELSARQGEALRRVFATRGSVAVKLLVSNFEDLERAIRLAEAASSGFAKNVKEIRENTTRKQWKRFTQNLGVLTARWIEGGTAGRDLADILNDVNDAMARSQEAAKSAGRTWAIFLGTLSRILEEWGKNIAKPWRLFDIKNAISWKEIHQEVIEEYEEINDLTKQTKSSEEALVGMGKKLNKQTRERLNLSGDISQIESSVADLLESQGASAVDVARAKLKIIENSEGSLDAEKRAAELIKRKNALVKAQSQMMRNLILKTRQDEMDLLEAQGATQLQIIDAKIAQARSNMTNINQNSQLLKIAQLRHRREIEIVRTQQKQVQEAKNLAVKYEKAAPEEKGEIRRLMELLDRPGEDLARLVASEGSDYNVIMENLSSFTEEQKNHIIETIAGMRDLPVEQLRKLTEEKGFEDVRGMFDDLTTSVPREFWDEWLKQGKNKLEWFRQAWQPEWQPKQEQTYLNTGFEPTTPQPANSSAIVGNFDAYITAAKATHEKTMGYIHLVRDGFQALQKIIPRQRQAKTVKVDLNRRMTIDIGGGQEITVDIGETDLGAQEDIIQAVADRARQKTVEELRKKLPKDRSFRNELFRRGGIK